MSEKSVVMEGEEYSLVSAAGFSQDENPMRFLINPMAFFGNEWRFLDLSFSRGGLKTAIGSRKLHWEHFYKLKNATQ